jgi:hypothetical protein
MVLSAKHGFNRKPHCNGISSLAGTGQKHLYLRKHPCGIRFPHHAEPEIHATAPT